MAFKIPQVQTGDRLMNQLQQNITSAIEPIFYQLTGKFLMSLSGCSTVPVGLATWQRATTDGPVTLQIPTLSGTSNTTGATLSGLPKGLWPTADQVALLLTKDNGAINSAYVTIGADGTMVLASSISSTTFTGSGAKGVMQTAITYLTAI